MKQWEPIPIAVIETVDNERRLTDTTASTLDGFAYAFLKAQRGAPLSQRQLASWANWSKRRAADTLNAVQKAQNDWLDQKRTKNAPPVETQNGPPNSNNYAQLEQSLDHKRTTNGPISDQKRTDRARTSTHNYTTLQLDSNVEISEKEPKPKKTRKRGKNIGTEATRKLWAQLNERRKERKKGARALKLTPEINRALLEVLTYAKPHEVLHAYEWFTTSNAANWWQKHNCDLSTFCRKKHLGQFINNSAEWTPEQDKQIETGLDILDLDEDQFDKDGNVIHFKNNRGNNGHQ